MRDPYDVLGVKRDASPAAIKIAFRKLAKKLHPDANKNDPKAAAQFSELNTAYEILGDEAKRKAFDRGEIDAEGKPRFQGFESAHAGSGFSPRGHTESFTWGPEGFQRGAGGGAGDRGFSGIDDILNEMLGGRANARRGRSNAGFQPDDFQTPTGRDVTATLTVTLEDLARRGTTRVRLPTGKEVEVKIPAGLTEGQQIRLKGQGLPGPGGGGDALITLNVASHRLFERDGANLRLEVPITLYEAVLGGKVRVPTLDGVIELAIPANTSSGRTFRIRGKGLPTKTEPGDLLATVRIVLPDSGDQDLEELMRKWRDSKAYDPGRER